MSKTTVTIAGALAALTLAACNPAADAGSATEPSARTLAAELKAAGSLGTLEALVTNSGLEQVLEGVGPYTVFAPADEAFAASTAFDFRDETEKAQAAALLRSHMVPGAVTLADVQAAIAGDEDGTVEMRTLDGAMIAFSQDADGVILTTPDGATARLAGDQVLASNGVIHPVSAVLLKPPA